MVFTQKGIDDVAQHFLAKAGIMAVRRVKKSDIEKLARATKAKIVTSLDDLSAKDLGSAGLVEERKISGEQMVFVEKCKDPKSVTIFVRGGTQQVVDEAERSIVDVIGAVSSVDRARLLRHRRRQHRDGPRQRHEELSQRRGRKGAARDTEVRRRARVAVPKTLAESAGMDAIDTLVQLRSKHKSKDGSGYGVDIIKEHDRRHGQARRLSSP